MTYAESLRAYHNQYAIKAYVNVAIRHAKLNLESIEWRNASDEYLDLVSTLIQTLPEDLTEQQHYILTECVTDEYVNFYDFMRAMESRQFA